MRFTKMHGLGNDYIYLNCMESMPGDPAALARRLSDRHFGVGGGRPDLHLPVGPGGFPHEDVQRRRFRGGHVRQRHPLPGQIRL